MDLRLRTDHRLRAPSATWLLVALAGVALGAATLACALAVDSRDYSARHSVLFSERAL